MKSKKLNRIILAIIFTITYSFFYTQNDTRIFDSLNAIVSSNKDPKTVINAKSELVLKYFLSGNKRKAIKLYNETLKEATAAQDFDGISFLYNNYANCLYNSNLIDSAKAYYMKAFTLTEKTKNKKLKLKLISNLGSIEYMNSNFKQAMDFYEKGLKLESDLKLEEGTYISINNIGFVYYALEIPKMAHKYFLKAERINKKNNNLNSLYYSYTGLSTTYHKLNNNDSAILYAKKSLELAQQLNDQYSVGFEYDNLGTLYKSMGNYSESIEYFKRGIEHNKMLKDERLAITLYGNITNVYILTKNTELANMYAEKALTLGEKLHLKADKKNLLKVFSYISAQKKEYKKAYEFLHEFISYKDSMYNYEIAKQISELQTKYETERKEKQNHLLQIDNEKKSGEINNQKTIRNYLIVIIFLFLAVAIGAFYTYRKIRSINSELNVKNVSIEQKNSLLEIQKKEILDSIHYAKRIQSSLLAHADFMNENISNNFILFKPKDIVSGDFYWATKRNDLFYLAVCDSTGHGVPGAFMSLLSIGFLSEAINEKNIIKPNDVFNYVRERLVNTISKEGQQDGFDGILLCFDQKTKKITYAAANNAPIVISNSEIISLGTDKMPVGKGIKDTPFQLFTVEMKQTDSLYLYTDGFADQFGGPRGKKFLYKKMNQYIASIADLSFNEQKQKLENTFNEWKGNLEQVDDVLLIGIKL